MNVEPRSHFQTAITTPFGELALVWSQELSVPRVERLLLPDAQRSAQALIQEAYPLASRLSCPAFDRLGDQIQRFLSGQDIAFGLDLVALERVSSFQRRVLVAEHKIPRGWVSTYGRIARHIGCHGGARSVGRALATNPFPIIIPCHRAVRSGGELAGYQGGLEMKRALLELEGVAFLPSGKVALTKVYYS